MVNCLSLDHRWTQFNFKQETLTIAKIEKSVFSIQSRACSFSSDVFVFAVYKQRQQNFKSITWFCKGNLIKSIPKNSEQVKLQNDLGIHD